MLACELIARCLYEGGVKLQFGLPGEGNIAIATALQELGAEFIGSRREDAAVSMADGWARRTGETGFVSVTHGPGLTNTVTALTEASRHGTPLLLLTGLTARESLHNSQRFPAEQLAQLTGAGWREVRGIPQIGEDVRAALAGARDQRRAFVLGVGAELLYEVVDADLVAEAIAVASSVVEPVPAAQLHPAAEAVSDAVSLLRSARKPLIVAGRGAASRHAAEAVRALGEHLAAPLSTTLVAKGLFTGSAQDIGVCGGFASAVGADLIAESDLVLAFGCSLNPWTGWYFGRQAGTDPKLIHVDADRAAFGRWRLPDVGVVGDAGLTAEAILRALRQAGAAPPAPRRAEFDEAAGRGDAAATTAEPEPPFSVTEVGLAARKWFPAEAVLSSDTGQATADVITYVEIADPSRLIYPIHAGSIGLGLGSAIGAAMAEPDRWTIHFTGDGSLMMALSELTTAAQHRLPLMVVVLDDEGYGAEVHYTRGRGLPESLAAHPHPDLGALAAAFGIGYRRISSLADLRIMRELAAEPGRGPILLHVPIDGDSASRFFQDYSSVGKVPQWGRG